MCNSKALNSYTIAVPSSSCRVIPTPSTLLLLLLSADPLVLHQLMFSAGCPDAPAEQHNATQSNLRAG
jgi:hypothetical protein